MLFIRDTQPSLAEVLLMILDKYVYWEALFLDKINLSQLEF